MIDLLLWEIAGAVACEVGAAAFKRGAKCRNVSPVELVSESPGRLRLRIPSIKNDHNSAQRIENDLARQKWVKEVKASPITSTVLIVYDEEKASPLTVELCAQLALTAALKELRTKSKTAGNILSYPMTVGSANLSVLARAD